MESYATGGTEGDQNRYEDVDEGLDDELPKLLTAVADRFHSGNHIGVATTSSTDFLTSLYTSF